MRRQIMACLWAPSALSASQAGAGIWAWGCQGQLGNQQIIFNRSSMFVVESKKPLGDIHRLKE